MSETVRLTRQEEIAIITIDNPPVNALGPGVPEAIHSAIESAGADTGVEALVVMGAGRTFIAGADIREFGKIVRGKKPRRTLLPLLAAVEACPKPVIMAIHGTALGGGLELAMAGHYRVSPAGRAGRAAGSEDRHDPRRGRNAAAAATGGDREGR